MKESSLKDGAVQVIEARDVQGSGSVCSTKFTSSTTKSVRAKIASVLISGVGFLADAYDLFVIDFVVAILSSTAAVEPTAGDKGLVVAATLAGAVVGQIGFGIGADFIGRRIMFISTAILVIFGSLASSLVGFGYRQNTLGLSVCYQLAICRFLLGLGIGGEYPLSATVAAESTEEESVISDTSSSTLSNVGKKQDCWFWFLSQKPNSIAAVFSMQGLGMLLSPIFVMFCIYIGFSLETTWRLCLGIGALPSAVAFIFRWKMHETAAFKKTQREYSIATTGTVETATTALYFARQLSSSSSELSSNNLDAMAISMNHLDNSGNPEHNKQKLVNEENGTLHQIVAVKDVVNVEVPTSTETHQHETRNHKKGGKFKSLGKHIQQSWRVLKKYRWILLGTSLTWFLIDVTLYGTGSFKSSVVKTWFITDQLEPSVTPATASVDTRALLEREDMTANEILRPITFQSSSRQQLQRNNVRQLLEWMQINKHNENNEASRIASVFQRILPGKRLLMEHIDLDERAKHDLMFQAQLSTIVALLAIPGYLLSVFFIHKTGVKRLQLWGFVAVGFVFIALGVEQILESKIRSLELILFGLTFLFSNFGPNTTTFILPAQLYPTLIRATCHGFSAAMGKLGGVVGTSVFSILERNPGLGWLLIICGCVAFTGAVFTLLIPGDNKAKELLTRGELELTKPAQGYSSNYELKANTEIVEV